MTPPPMTTMLRGRLDRFSAPVESMQYSWPGTGIIMGTLPVAITTYFP